MQIEIEIEAELWVPSGRGDARRGGEGWDKTQKENEKSLKGFSDSNFLHPHKASGTVVSAAGKLRIRFEPAASCCPESGAGRAVEGSRS